MAGRRVRFWARRRSTIEDLMDDTTQTLPPQTQDRQPGREAEMNPAPDYMPRFPGSGRLAGKTAIVTGGDSGIGRAVSVAFAREGANIGLLYLEETEDAQETQRLIEAEGSQAFCVAGDIGDEAFCRHAVDHVAERFGGLDVLINNAGEQHVETRLEELSDAQLRQTFDTNLFGFFYMTKTALPKLKRGAAVVNCTSVTAYKGNPALIDYSATKGAIVSFTRALAQSVADRGIRVNAVAPGPIWTPLIPASFSAEHVAKFGADVPLGRPGQPNEVASCFVFLACEDSSYMTGQVLHPNGGTPVGS
jgi:NAD(P)-dependent dehydrogenase (short-subunit alcohol dehydrogenase family)